MTVGHEYMTGNNDEHPKNCTDVYYPAVAPEKEAKCSPAPLLNKYESKDHQTA